MFYGLIQRLLNLRVTDEVVNRSHMRMGLEGIFQKILDHVEIKSEVNLRNLAKIPRSGPLIVVANHPTGFAEGLAVPALLDSIRPDLTVMGHTYFQRWPALASRMILVNPQASSKDKTRNSAGLKAAAILLRKGRCLMVFPAGEVARPQTGFLKSEELPWRTGLGHLVRLSGATVVPIHVSGDTSVLFKLLSRIHPRLGSITLCREFLKRSGGSIRLTVGTPIPPEFINQDHSITEIVKKYRSAVLDLGDGGEEKNMELDHQLVST